MVEELKFKSYDGKELVCYLWDEVANPKGVVQLVHGLTSHARRYDDFAEVLNQNGYIVFGDDHRMNGKTAGLENLGKAGYNNFYENVEDELSISRMLKEKYKLPLFLFGHSYGSFLTQRYIQMQEGLADAVILSASAYMGGSKLFLGKVLTFFQRVFFNVHAPGNMFFEMTFSSNDKYFEEDKLKNAWLNRDFEKVRAFNEDPYCDFVMSHGFFYAMMRGLYDAYRPENLDKIDKNLPILIVSGDKDPLGGMGEKVKRLYEMYKALGLNVQMKLYENVRHELTADFESEKIIGDLVAFFDANV